jgi:hypothetical protein
MHLFKGYEDGLDVAKIDRKGRVVKGGASALVKFLNNNRVCVDGVVVNEKKSKVTITVNTVIDGKFRTVIRLKDKKDIQMFRDLVGNRVVIIRAKTVNCKICIGILFGYGRANFDSLLYSKYPDFDVSFMVDKLKNISRIFDHFVVRMWVD